MINILPTFLQIGIVLMTKWKLPVHSFITKKNYAASCFSASVVFQTHNIAYQKPIYVIKQQNADI